MNRQNFIINKIEDIENQISNNIVYLLVADKGKKINLKSSKENRLKASKITELFFNSKIIDNGYKYIGVYGTGNLNETGYDGIFLKNDKIYFVETKSSFLYSTTKSIKTYKQLLDKAEESIFDLKSVSSRLSQLSTLNGAYNLSSKVIEEINIIIYFLDKCDINANNNIKNSFDYFPIKNIIINLFNNAENDKIGDFFRLNEIKHYNDFIFINAAKTYLSGDELSNLYDKKRNEWVKNATIYRWH